MKVSKNEAQAALVEISNAALLTRKSIAHGSASAILILWGIIWAICYGIGQFFPNKMTIGWIVGAVLGSLMSWVFGAKNRSNFKGPNDLKIAKVWVFAILFACLWAYLLLPVGFEVKSSSGENVSNLMGKKIGAYAATVPMFLYIIGGIWLGRFFVWLGVMITFLTVIGFFFAGSWFQLWMSVVGGGGLILSGLFIHRYWR